MRASVGDRIVVASNRIEGPVRDGRIVEVRHPDGSPPYVVEWSDTGERALVFPGPDAHVEHFVGETGAGGPGAAEAEPTATVAGMPTQRLAPPGARHVKSWRVDVDLFETGEETTAHAVLMAEAPEHVEARGHAHRNPIDRDIPEIGDEVAVARALRRLADRLLGVASDDIADIEGHAVHLHE